MTKMLPMLDPFDEIKRLYFTTTAQTIERDLARALDLLTRMASDEQRDRVAGYIHGLADLQREWKQKAKQAAGKSKIPASTATPNARRSPKPPKRRP